MQVRELSWKVQLWHSTQAVLQAKRGDPVPPLDDEIKDLGDDDADDDDFI